MRTLLFAYQSFVQDLRYAARSWRRTPGFAATAVLTLTIGIAVNTAVFSLVNAVLLRPLPFPEVSRIVWFLNSTPDGISAGASDAKFNTWRTLSSTFESVSGFAFPSMLLRTGDRFDEVIVGHVTPQFFSLFGAKVEIGRVFTTDEGVPGGHRVALISDSLWRRRFGARDARGQLLELDRQQYEIVGVLEPGFDSKTFTTARYADADVWVPLVIDPASMDVVNHFAIAGRLRPNVSLMEAQARVSAAAEQLRRRLPEYFQQTDRATVLSFQSVLARHDRQQLLVLTGAVGLVLLIACANIANLLLSRAADRASEIATRAALGATRARLVGQLLTEAVLLTCVGAILGIGMGRFAIQMVVHWTGPTITRIGLTGSGVPTDPRVVVYAAAASLLAFICFSVAPAVIASRIDLSARFAGRSGPRSRNRLGGVVTAAEMALAVVLLVAATLLIRTFANIGAVPVGFDTNNLIAFQMTRDAAGHRASELAQSIEEASDALRTIPGVVRVTASEAAPFDPDTAISLRYIIEGRPLNGAYHGIDAWRPVGSQYFETLQIPLVRGRLFTSADSFHSLPVIIINQAMADKWWPRADPIGQRVIVGRGSGGWENPPRQIIGVVANVRDESLDQDPIPTNYVPFAQLNDVVAASVLKQVAWIVRTSGSRSLSPRILESLGRFSGGMPTVSLGDISATMDGSRARARFRMWLMTAFAGIATFLAAIGVYGVASYRVRRRTREIGIRLALGADTPDVVREVLLDSLRFSVAGLLIGVGLAASAARILNALVFGVTSRDPASFAVTCCLVLLVAIVAAWLPARRAASVDPIVALRCE